MASLFFFTLQLPPLHPLNVIHALQEAAVELCLYYSALNAASFELQQNTKERRYINWNFSHNSPP